MYVCMYVCMYAHTYIHMYVCMYVLCLFLCLSVCVMFTEKSEHSNTTVIYIITALQLTATENLDRVIEEGN